MKQNIIKQGIHNLIISVYTRCILYNTFIAGKKASYYFRKIIFDRMHVTGSSMGGAKAMQVNVTGKKVSRCIMDNFKSVQYE